MRRLFPLLLTALLAACSSETTPPGPDASTVQPGTDASAVDAGVAEPDTGVPADAAMPDDAAMPPDAADPGDAGPKCTSQAECGNPVENLVANVCQGSHCHPPGLVDNGTLQKVDVALESLYAASFSQPGNRPATQITRFIWPFHVDGTPVTCADVKARSSGTDATLFDKDPTLNQAYRALYALVWQGTATGQVRFPIPANVPRGRYLVYAEAWRGPRDGQYPTGMRASSFCKEEVDLTTVPATPTPQIRIELNPQ
jgi:hypothetical protein